MAHPLHRVTCKAAIYSPNGLEVLAVNLLYLGPNAYGLPGGHVQEGESPDKAMERELLEEVGLADVPLARQDFWHHEDGKIVLGYVGRLADDKLPAPPDPSREIPKWLSLRDIARGVVDVGSYKEFILHNAREASSHPVSCKVAIYSPDGSKVLVLKYPQRNYHGLPGGHLEKGEQPEDTLRREFQEELGANMGEFITNLKKRDFWVHPGGKVALAFTATAKTTELPQPPDPELEIGEWVDVTKLDVVPIDAYRQFIIENQPK
jgi:ADP-ribose pyrophosphatase YjhB (NUDIX family)